MARLPTESDDHERSIRRKHAQPRNSGFTALKSELAFLQAPDPDDKVQLSTRKKIALMKQISQPTTGVFVDLWLSFLALPLWVKVWMFLILIPVNVASLFFLRKPTAIWIAILANLGLVLNTPVLVYERGFTKALAIPHLVPWTILVLWILFARPAATAFYDSYLTVLLVVNFISLLFDYPDAWAWFRARSTD